MGKINVKRRSQGGGEKSKLVSYRRRKYIVFGSIHRPMYKWCTKKKSAQRRLTG
jgi:hypothetical protein